MHRLGNSHADDIKIESPYFTGLRSQDMFSSSPPGNIPGGINTGGTTILSMVYIDPLCSNRISLLDEKYQYRSHRSATDNENKLKSIDHFLKKKKPKKELPSGEEATASTSSTRISNLSCAVCQKLFQRSFDLRRHEATHTGAKPYKCEICDKYFKQKAHLQKHHLIHLRIHDMPIVTDATAVGIASSSSSVIRDSSSLTVSRGSRPRRSRHCCTECDKIFSSKFSLDRHHRNIHSGYRPYGCDVCNKHFQQKTHLKKHLSSVHTSSGMSESVVSLDVAEVPVSAECVD